MLKVLLIAFALLHCSLCAEGEDGSGSGEEEEVSGDDQAETSGESSGDDDIQEETQKEDEEAELSSTDNPLTERPYEKRSSFFNTSQFVMTLSTFLNQTELRSTAESLLKPIPTKEEGYIYNNHMRFGLFPTKHTPRKSHQTCFREGGDIFGPRDFKEHQLMKEVNATIKEITVRLSQVGQGDNTYQYSNGFPVPVIYGTDLIEVSISSFKCLKYIFAEPKIETVNCNRRLAFFCGFKTTYEEDLVLAQKERLETEEYLREITNINEEHQELLYDVDHLMKKLPTVDNCDTHEDELLLNYKPLAAGSLVERLIEINEQIDTLRDAYRQLRDLLHELRYYAHHRPYQFEGGICFLPQKPKAKKNDTEKKHIFPQLDQNGFHEVSLTDIVLAVATLIGSLIGVIGLIHSCYDRYMSRDDEDDESDYGSGEMREQMELVERASPRLHSRASINRVRFSRSSIDSSSSSSSSGSTPSRLEQQFLPK